MLTLWPKVLVEALHISINNPLHHLPKATVARPRAPLILPALVLVLRDLLRRVLPIHTHNNRLSTIINNLPMRRFLRMQLTTLPTAPPLTELTRIRTTVRSLRDTSQ